MPVLENRIECERFMGNRSKGQLICEAKSVPKHAKKRIFSTLYHTVLLCANELKRSFSFGFKSLFFRQRKDRT